jgi:hypothetical protein
MKGTTQQHHPLLLYRHSFEPNKENTTPQKALTIRLDVLGHELTNNQTNCSYHNNEIGQQDRNRMNVSVY